MHQCRVKHLLTLVGIVANRLYEQTHVFHPCLQRSGTLPFRFYTSVIASAGDASDNSHTGAARDDQFTELVDTIDVVVINLLDFRWILEFALSCSSEMPERSYSQLCRLCNALKTMLGLLV